MRVKEIIKILPSELFTVLSKKYNIDYKAKKLPGETIFKVLLFSMFSEKNYSLSKLQANFNDETFQKKYLKNEEITTIDKSSFHYRLNKIDSNFFREIFEKSLQKLKNIPLLKNERKYNLFIFDSTLVSLSSKLLFKTGFKFGGKNCKTKKLKYTFGLSEFPEVIKIHSNYNKNENKSLIEAILGKDIAKNTILLFDRGINSREILDKISKKNYFITRLNRSYRVKIESRDLIKTETETIKLNKEVTGKLYNSKSKLTSETYRIIHGKAKISNWDKKKETKLKVKMSRPKYKNSLKSVKKEEILKEDIIFLTNIPKEYIDSDEIAEIYRKRWQIEQFFKLIKQELHFSHLINRSENGIKIMLYITMIFVLLLMLYKSTNNLKGYKYVKYKLLLELQEEFYDYVAEISGGTKQKWRQAIGNPFF